MAEFSFKNIFLAGVGATAYSFEKAQELVDDLVKKGELVRSKRGVYYYSPAVSREEYGSGAARRLAEKLYGGGLTKLFASFVEGGEFTSSELDELRAMLDRTREE